jgi:hypothetical protein
MLRPAVSRSVCLGVNTPCGALDQIFITVRQLRVCWRRVPSVKTGRVCRLQLLLSLARAVILGFESLATHEHTLLIQIRDSPNLEIQVPVFMSPRNRVAHLKPQALGSLFVASYQSQSCGGNIWIRLNAGILLKTERLRSETNRLMLFREAVAVYCGNHTEHTYIYTVSIM